MNVLVACPSLSVLFSSAKGVFCQATRSRFGSIQTGWAKPVSNRFGCSVNGAIDSVLEVHEGTMYTSACRFLNSLTKQCLTGLDTSQTGLLLGNMDANALFEHLQCTSITSTCRDVSCNLYLFTLLRVPALRHFLHVDLIN